MKLQAEDIELININKLKPYSRNRKKHSKAQIDRLKKLMAYQGNRVPMIVDRATNEVISGNGRLQALKELGEKEVPVIFQEFEDEDQRYAFSISDNAVGLMGELDLAAISFDMGDMDPSFDIDHLGIAGFTLDVAEKTEGKPAEVKTVTCPACGAQFAPTKAK